MQCKRCLVAVNSDLPRILIAIECRECSCFAKLRKALVHQKYWKGIFCSDLVQLSVADRDSWGSVFLRYYHNRWSSSDCSSSTKFVRSILLNLFWNSQGLRPAWQGAELKSWIYSMVNAMPCLAISTRPRPQRLMCSEACKISGMCCRYPAYCWRELGFSLQLLRPGFWMDIVDVFVAIPLPVFDSLVIWSTVDTVSVDFSNFFRFLITDGESSFSFLFFLDGDSAFCFPLLSDR